MHQNKHFFEKLKVILEVQIKPNINIQSVYFLCISMLNFHILLHTDVTALLLVSGSTSNELFVP